MRTVKELLQRKGYEIHAISPNATVFDALTLMAAKNVGALLVLDGQTLVGVISERDYARKVILHGKSSKETPVREIMTSRVVHVSPDTPVEACMALMTDKHVRHLPVMDDGALIGVISIGDVVNAIISNQQFAIDQLKTFHEYDPRDR
jgi:CBS domain-containing protein